MHYNAIIGVLLLLMPKVNAELYCYSSGGVFGIVIASVVITLLVISVSLIVIWYLWRNDRIKLDFILPKSKRVNAKTDVESANHEYAFDNPYFKDDDVADGIKKADHEKPIFAEERGDAKDYTIQNDYISEEHMNKNHALKNKKNEAPHNAKGLFKNFPITDVFNNLPILNHKYKHDNYQKSMDDSSIVLEPERLSVELTGHDFTGLGFNICGNIREGIFVKNILNRGPANECGKIKSGDKIVSMSVSFEKMVYEDALTILSYASPYNITLVLEKVPQLLSSKENCLKNPQLNKNIVQDIASGGGSQRLSHPVYRSHSIDDLSQTGKESSPSDKSQNSGIIIVQKLKSQILNFKQQSIKSTTSNKSYNSNTTDDTIVKSQDSDQNLGIPKEFIENKDKNKETLSCDGSEFIKPQDSLVKENISHNEPTDIEENNITPDTIHNNNQQIPQQNTTKKTVTPAKRKGKAPQPPNTVTHQPISIPQTQVSQINHETVKTTAEIHYEEREFCQNQCDTNEQSENMTLKVNGKINCFNQSDNDDTIASQTKVIQVPVKPKSSSLGDLSNHFNNKKLYSVLLERAVSLDLQSQSLPEENLQHHGKNLLVPTNESDDLIPINNCNKSYGLTNLKNIDIDISDSSEIALNLINEPFINNNNNIESHIEECADECADECTDECTDECADSSLNSNVTGNKEDSIDAFTVLEQNASTPLSKSKSAIDEYIKLDLSSSSSSMEDIEESTLIDETKNVEETNMPQINMTNICANIEDNCSTTKEVIEISPNELDDVMMSHRAYLIKKTTVTGSNYNIPPASGDTIGDATGALDFESWSYYSDDGSFNNNNNVNLINSGTTIVTNEIDSTQYASALDFNQSEINSKNQSLENQLPEIAGITFKSEIMLQNKDVQSITVKGPKSEML